MVESTALPARYELPSLHSTPAHFPFSTVSCLTHLLGRRTPPCASTKRASAWVNCPDPPLGMGRPECCCRASEYARRAVTGDSAGSETKGEIYSIKVAPGSPSNE